MTTTADTFAGLDTFAETTDDMWADFQAAATTPAPVEVAPVVRCQGCDGPIRSAKSLAGGYGKGCWAKANRRDRLAALAVTYTPAQIADAVELVEDGGVIHLRGRVYL